MKLSFNVSGDIARKLLSTAWLFEIACHRVLSKSKQIRDVLVPSKIAWIKIFKSYAYDVIPNKRYPYGVVYLVYGIWESARSLSMDYNNVELSDWLLFQHYEREVNGNVIRVYDDGSALVSPYARKPIHKSEQEKIIEKYTNALLREITMYSKITENSSLRVIDIHAGGGTPSLIPGKYWKAILEKLSELFEAEPKIAIEANPEDLRDETYTFNLVESGVNEVSLGVQSFNSKILKTLGRRHSVEDSIKAIENLRNAGCKYINIDLMYMVPGQTLEEWIKDLETASQQDVDEITCYPTLITPHSIGYKLIKEGKIPAQPNKKVFKKMVYACEDILPPKGFKGVEIYGYSRRKEWKYVTVNYEMEGPLLGFGCGAMGFTGGYEYVNTHSVKNFINSVLNDRLPIAGAREVALVEWAIRYTVCRLFVCRILDKKNFKLKFNREFNELIGRTSFSKALYLLKITVDIREDNERILLTRKGLFTAHKICWAFVLNVPCRIAEEYLKIPWPLKVVVP